jgi:WD40 repeat protein
MNKDVLNQIPAEEQPIASKLNSLIEDMQPSQVFQWELENQLMEKAAMQPSPSRIAKVWVPLGWAIFAVGSVFLLNWVLGSLVPPPPAASGPTATQEVSFVDNVRAGGICAGPLALAHGFDVFLTNEDKTGFVPVDTGNMLAELRSFAWSPDGTQLAIVGNAMGSGNIYITDPTGGETGYLLSGSEAGYVRDAAWSRDGRQFVLWSSQNNTTLYLLSALGDGLVEKQLDVQILGTPQIAPDGNIVFYGADKTAAGLFLVTSEDSQPALILPFVEDESSFAFSPDGSILAYMEYDRDKGEARLSTLKLSEDEYKLLGTLPIPKGSGSAIPDAANLSWSTDGTSLLFDFGRSPTDRAIYLAHADGSGLIKVVNAAYAPTLSSDGKCLAYISEGQVYLMDLTKVLSSSTTSGHVILAELPRGKGTPGFRLDKLQWKPNP